MTQTTTTDLTSCIGKVNKQYNYRKNKMIHNTGKVGRRPSHRQVKYVGLVVIKMQYGN